jgi:hypothetical protein
MKFSELEDDDQQQVGEAVLNFMRWQIDDSSDSGDVFRENATELMRDIDFSKYM